MGFMHSRVYVHPNLLTYLPSPLPAPSHPYSFPFGNHNSVLYVCESISILEISSFISFFVFLKDSTYTWNHKIVGFSCLQITIWKKLNFTEKTEFQAFLKQTWTSGHTKYSLPWCGSLWAQVCRTGIHSRRGEAFLSLTASPSTCVSGT